MCEDQEFDTRYQDMIVCPWCGSKWYDDDSYYASAGTTEETCEECGREFSVEANIEVTYTTSRKLCENDEHEYEYDRFHFSTQDYQRGQWINLPEEKWKKVNIFKCKKCHHEDFRREEIKDEEWEQARNDANRRMASHRL